MEIVGGGKMHVYPPADEYPHQPDGDPSWQESFVLHFYDLKQRVGGLFRIGHEPGNDGGRMNIWSNIASPDGTFHRANDVPLQRGDFLENGLRGDNDAIRYQYEGERIHWRINERGVSADLDVVDLHPAIDGWKRGKLAEYISHHVEVACHVTGTVTTQGHTYQIDSMGMRDHGWGRRSWTTNRAHRWTVGTFDRDNSFCAVAMLTDTGTLAKVGWVVRGDKIIYADKVEIVAYVECDGASNRGGFTRMTLTTGEVFEAHFELMGPGICSWIHGRIGMDNFCCVRWGNRIGGGCFETSANIQAGTHRPTVFDVGTIAADGWYPTNVADR